LPEEDFRELLGKELFGPSATAEATTDALFLQQVFADGRTWCQAAPVISPSRVNALQATHKLTDQMRAEYRSKLSLVRKIEIRYRNEPHAFAEMHRIAKWVSGQWTEESAKLLDP